MAKKEVAVVKEMPEEVQEVAEPDELFAGLESTSN